MYLLCLADCNTHVKARLQKLKHIRLEYLQCLLSNFIKIRRKCRYFSQKNICQNPIGILIKNFPWSKEYKKRNLVGFKQDADYYVEVLTASKELESFAALI